MVLRQLEDPRIPATTPQILAKDRVYAFGESHKAASKWYTFVANRATGDSPRVQTCGSGKHFIKLNNTRRVKVNAAA